MGPGPGAYTLPSLIGSGGHRYSFGLKTDSRPLKPGPGPAAYKLDKLTRFGKSEGGQFSIMRREEMNKPYSVHHRY
ncbi:uncharacterized protein Dwil_GK27443 [Drosophila willistoni]|uniref:Uncharacterized protein n=1 Tax=Drosophila willistoni TaxID=7260 RepID=A0A0Q9WQ06_DROWI|nr:uncharacterized protein Dwil_GK27443 [Drosophila willistoni]